MTEPAGQEPVGGVREPGAGRPVADIVVGDPGLRANRHYRRLFVARTISNVGNGIAPIALAFGILALPDGSPTGLSIVLAAQAVPLIVMLPLGGVIADRLGRARVIAVADVAVSLLVGIVAVLFLTGNATVPVLAGISVATGMLHALWWPAYTGLIPDVVAEDHLQPANAYLSVASNGGLILGNAIGGLLVATVGSGVAIAIDAVTFLVAGLLVATFRHLSPPHDSGERMLDDLRQGWRVFVSFRWVVVLVGVFSVLVMALRGAEEVMGPVLALQEYGGARGWAVVLGCHSAGLVVGALVGSRIRVGRPMLVGTMALLVLPVWLVVLALALPLPVVSAGAFAWGVAIELFAVLWFTSLHRNVPREAMSRVGAYDAMGSLMFGPIGLALAGPLITAAGLRTGFLVAAALTLVAILAALASPSVRRLRG